VGLAFGMLVAPAGTAQAAAPGGATYVLDDYLGFDRCAAPSTATMHSWWTSSPYFYYGVYIGGINRACSNPNLSASWVSTVAGQGWSLVPIWVGNQPPCAGYAHPISYDVATAKQQGIDSAINAMNTSFNYGFDIGTIIYLDIEAYASSSTTACRNAVNSYLNGWSLQVKQNYSSKAGAYGSSCGSFVADWASLANVPNDVFPAAWNNVHTVWNLSCLSNPYWVGDRRIHQYNGNVTQTYGGVALQIDPGCGLGHAAAGGINLNEVDAPGTVESNGPTEDPTCG
jgi:hypothetical protein